MLDSKEVIVNAVVTNRLGQHFTNLHNAVQNFKSAKPGQHSSLRQSISFHLAKIMVHKNESGVIDGWRKCRLLTEAAELVAEGQDVQLIRSIREFNSLVASPNFRDECCVSGVLGKRSLMLAQLNNKNILRHFPWIF